MKLNTFVFVSSLLFLMHCFNIRQNNIFQKQLSTEKSNFLELDKKNKERENNQQEVKSFFKHLNRVLL
jgi:hypothetical protein